MHTTEQRREIFKSCEKEMLFLHEIMGNKNMSEILRPMIKEKFMDMNYKMAEMYMEAYRRSNPATASLCGSVSYSNSKAYFRGFGKGHD